MITSISNRTTLPSVSGTPYHEPNTTLPPRRSARQIQTGPGPGPGPGPTLPPGGPLGSSSGATVPGPAPSSVPGPSEAAPVCEEVTEGPAGSGSVPAGSPLWKGTRIRMGSNTARAG